FLYSASAWSLRRFSSAMAAATCCLARANWLRMSATIWSSIFSGFSAFEIRSLMLDLSSVASRSKSPISAGLAEGGQLTQVRRERQGDALIARQELLVIEVGEFERFGEHDLVLLDPVGAVQQVGGVEFEEPPTEGA